MGNLTIRNLDDNVIETLKAQARTNQRSLEAEVRYLLTQVAERRINIAGMTNRVQTDSVDLLQEDRNR